MDELRRTRQYILSGEAVNVGGDRKKKEMKKKKKPNEKLVLQAL